ncbi:hypothetical protein ILUMI_27200 [Ignelater luminosus]|uniref:Uncharacterized protein n=1 Tax=Ignelater luminosus TaxID=2038154 RepID=A0A8K0FVQ7_IGNLU|nr:hypothetical protein ILUMI_27200 [Ignelater luminosus]
MDINANESIGKTKFNINATDRIKPWFTQEVEKLAEEKRKSYLIYRSSPTYEKYLKYVETKNRVNSRIKTTKRENWTKFTSDMNHNIYGTQRKVWKMLKNRKTPVTSLYRQKNIKIKTRDQYFKELDTAENNIELGRENENLGFEQLIEENFVTEKLKKLKNRKATGVDNTSNELLKYADYELTRESTILFDEILKTTTIEIIRFPFLTME